MFVIELFLSLSMQIQLKIGDFINFMMFKFVIDPSVFILNNIVAFHLDHFVLGTLDGFVRKLLHVTGADVYIDTTPTSRYALYLDKLDDFFHSVAVDIYELAKPIPHETIVQIEHALGDNPLSPIVNSIVTNLELREKYALLSAETKTLLWVIPSALMLVVSIFTIIYVIFFFFSLIGLFAGVTKYGDAYLLPNANDITELLAADEEEVGAMDDILFLLLCVFASCMWFTTVVVLYYVHPITYIGGIFLIYPLAILALFAAPVNTFIDYGLAFPAYLRGSVNSSFLSFEAVFDCIAVCTALTRLTAQQIRLLFVLVAYSEVEHFVYTNSLKGEDAYTFFTTFYDEVVSQNDPWNTAYYLVVEFPLFVFNTIYLLFHFMEMLINQLGVYFILVFWFFAFLYNYFFYKKLEKHFAVKRSLFKRK